MSQYEVARAENEKAILRIEYDQDAESPREWDNLGTFYTWQRNYHSPDKHSFSEPRDFMESLASEVGIDDEQVEEANDAELMELVQQHVLILPVYKYEHGGVAYNTGGFSCPWDSGQVGWIFVTHKDVIKEYGLGALKDGGLEKAEKVLEGEVEVYSNWANGDVFWFSLERKVPHWGSEDPEKPGDYEFDPDDEDTYDLEPLDSCSGFYGWDWDTNGIKEQIDQEYNDLIAKL